MTMSQRYWREGKWYDGYPIFDLPPLHAALAQLIAARVGETTYVNIQQNKDGGWEIRVTTRAPLPPPIPREGKE